MLRRHYTVLERGYVNNSDSQHVSVDLQVYVLLCYLYEKFYYIEIYIQKYSGKVIHKSHLAEGI